MVAECSKCGAVMRCNKTKSARFVVRDASGREVVSGMSGHNLSIKLLMTPKKLYHYNDRNVVLCKLYLSISFLPYNQKAQCTCS